MKSPKIDQRITALAQLETASNKVRFRTKAVQELLLAGDEEGLVFAVEMLREAVSGVNFWFAQLEKAVTK